MRKVNHDEANRALEELFGAPEGSINSFILTTNTDGGGDVWSNMCCEKHIYMTLVESANAVAIGREIHPN